MVVSEPQQSQFLCRALDVLPLRPGRTEGRRRLTVVDPRRHKPDSAKGSAPRGPVQPIGPENSKRAPAKRRASASEEAASPSLDAGQLLLLSYARNNVHATSRSSCALTWIL